MLEAQSSPRMSSNNLPQILKYKTEDDHEDFVKDYREELEVKCGCEVFTSGDGQGFCVAGQCDLPHTRNVIVGVHGAYRENNPKDARSSIGIYWGYDHPTNQSHLIQQEVYNKGRAEVVSMAHCLGFLDIFWTNLIKNDIRPWKKVIIKTDSWYAVNSMTNSDGILRWESDNWMMVEQEVQNKDVFKRILILMRSLAINNLPVQFWHVGPEWNEEAIDLAEGVLDKASDLEMSWKMERLNLDLPPEIPPEKPPESCAWSELESDVFASGDGSWFGS